MIEEFAALFVGRNDAYGAWHGEAKHTPVTLDTYRGHLMFGEYIGIYPTVGSACKWGCVDIDTDDYGLARQLAASLRYKDGVPFVERTVRGWHVWMFADKWLHASDMRHGLLAACKAVGYNPKEVNPKQSTVEDTRVGNYVRLPYYGYLADGMPPNRFMVDINGESVDLETFLDTDPLYTTCDSIEGMAALWKPPQRKAVHLSHTSTEYDIGNLMSLMSGHSKTIFDQGPLIGNDRSGTLFKLAMSLRRDMIADAALVVLTAADAAWGKYGTRADGEERLRQIVENAYGFDR